MLTGLTAATFRILLGWAAAAREDLVRHGHDTSPIWCVAVVVGCAAATSLAAWLVHRVEPHAEGSGIPRVEAVVEGRTPPGRFRILPVKYVGGVLAIGSGLALGREGPSVQMGGNIGIIVATLTRRSAADLRLLVAAGAAAGLATAFNAPIAGGVFVLEELLRRFDPRTTLATLAASAAGFASAHLLLPPTSDYSMPPLGQPRLAQAPIVLLVGVATGVFGAGYNWAVMRGLAAADRSRIPVTARAAIIGGSVGLLGWFAPHLVGGGDELTQEALLGRGTALGVAVVLVIRAALGVVSYAALTPGGLFAPMVMLGAWIGLEIGLLGEQFWPAVTPEPAALALIGMAAFFTATVRAPVTGLILATELTGTVVLLSPMLGACAIAMLVAGSVGAKPIYDQLTDRAVRAARENLGEDPAPARQPHP